MRWVCEEERIKAHTQLTHKQKERKCVQKFPKAQKTINNLIATGAYKESQSIVPKFTQKKFNFLLLGSLTKSYKFNPTDTFF